jgi:6-phosphofructokinase 1
MEGDTSRARNLEIQDIASIHLHGGSVLQTSRANPTKNPDHLAAVVKSLDALGIDHLVTIGGDDTAHSAKKVSEAAGGRIKVAHVPKTIDNDLPLPRNIPTFGYETAREQGARVLAALMEDAYTRMHWFFVVMMGRNAGHLALGAGKAAGVTLTLIPEEFQERPIRLESLTRIVEGSVLKRLADGKSYGVCVISEGVAEEIAPEDFGALDGVDRDEHGHIRLADVPLGRVLRTGVQAALAKRGIKLAVVEKDVGYELRCVQPNAFDRDYTRDLGAGAVLTLLAGGSGVLITRQDGAIVPIPFAELVDPKTNRTKVRLVDTSTDSYRFAREIQVRLERSDLEDSAKAEAIARAGNLTPEELKERFAGVC